MTLFVVLALCVVPAVTAHGAIAHPPMREPAGKAAWCPFCQGNAQGYGIKDGAPPTPCLSGIPGTTIPSKYFQKWGHVIGPDGTPWVDQLITSQPVPVWCPGDTVTTHTFVFADHNGVYRWESQLAAPGLETEKGFANFTSWRSVNQDPDTDYYASDGTTKLTPGKCYAPGKCRTWTPKCGHCRNRHFAKTTLTLPSNMPAGQTVLRWFWYGAMKTDGEHVTGPEHSLFVNCKDIIVGTAKQCQPTPTPPSPVPPTPPSPVPPTPPSPVPPTPPTPVPPAPPTPTPPTPAPTPTPPQPSKPQCCWSKWGDKDSCGNYPSGLSGAHCNTDFSKKCSSSSNCQSRFPRRFQETGSNYV